MKNKAPVITGEVVGAAYRPDRAQRLLCSLRKALELHHRRDISFAELGTYSGESASTAFDKLQRKHHPQIESLLTWLERLPIAARTDLLETTLRCYPTIEHPWISHDASQVSLLRRAVDQISGLNVVHGPSPGPSTFIATAIGHSYGALKGNPDVVVGLDTHEPDWFVPLPRVTYLPGPHHAEELEQAVLKFWERLERRRGNLIILNGLPFHLVQRTAIQLSRVTPVLLCGERSSGVFPSGAEMPKGTTFFEVSEAQGARIRVALRSA